MWKTLNIIKAQASFLKHILQFLFLLFGIKKIIIAWIIANYTLTEK
jgi:hypothetical protein